MELHILHSSPVSGICWEYALGRACHMCRKWESRVLHLYNSYVLFSLAEADFSFPWMVYFIGSYTIQIALVALCLCWKWKHKTLLLFLGDNCIVSWGVTHSIHVKITWSCCPVPGDEILQCCSAMHKWKGCPGPPVQTCPNVSWHWEFQQQWQWGRAGVGLHSQTTGPSSGSSWSRV